MLKVTTDKVRYLNKNNNANERENYSKWWKEQIEHYGTSVDYFSLVFKSKQILIEF